MTWTDNDVASLLYDLCVKLGFCLPPEEQARLKADPPEDLEEATPYSTPKRGPRTTDQRLSQDVRDMTAEAKRRVSQNVSLDFIQLPHSPRHAEGSVTRTVIGQRVVQHHSTNR